MRYGDYPNVSKVKRVLVIKLRHHGDVLLTSPVFSNLQIEMPSAVIDAMVFQETVPMLDGHPAIHDYVTYDREWKKLTLLQRMQKEIGLLHTIQRRRYDLVINLTEGDRGAIATLVSRAPIGVGFDPEGKGLAGKRWFYSHLVKPCKTPRHSVEKNLDAIRRIGIFPTPENRDLYFHVSQHHLDTATQLLGNVKKFFLLHPTSRWRFKCWPTSVTTTLIRALQDRGETVVVTAGPAPHEIKMVDDILHNTSHVVNLAGKTSLKQLGALIQLSECLICVDSLPLHISSALKSKAVVLFGPSSELSWGPWNNPNGRVVAQNYTCRPCGMDGCGGSKVSDCLVTLPVSRVLDAIYQG